MNWDQIENIFFLGIGGIGMSGLAKYFHSQGKMVSGYDKTPSSITQELEELGIQITYVDDLNDLQPQIDCVIYTPAIPITSVLFCYFQSSNIYMIKRAAALGLISREYKTIGVSGSHGKTTVSSMITHVLKSAGVDCSAFLGGISVNYGSNYVQGTAPVVVIEADEYDRSFHQLTPSIAIVTAVDTDHLDIYGTRENIEEAFCIFLNGLKDDKLIIAQCGISILSRLSGKLLKTYSVSDSSADIFAHSIQFESGEMKVGVIIDSKNTMEFTLGVPGIHNVENALAALHVAMFLNLDTQKVIEGFKSFKGIKRRFELIHNSQTCLFYDDYAHHPEEILAFLSSLKMMYDTKRLCVVFQPHLYSRTSDLAAGFANSLSIADRVLLMDIYPARELPIPGVSSELIASKMEASKVKLVNHDNLLDAISEEHFDIICTVGAGDIDRSISSIKEWLINNKS